jgi:molybdopterin synthase sulfur carrier subunit
MLRRLTSDSATVEVAGATVGEVIDNLEAAHAGLKAELLAADGQIHRFVNIYLNDDDVRFIDKLDTPVSDKDVISILPAVAGGATQTLAPGNGADGPTPGRDLVPTVILYISH